MNENIPHEQPDWQDTFLDRSLAEVVGGETPPDLTERILAAAAEPSSDPVTLVPGAEPMQTPSSKAKYWITLAVAVSLCRGCRRAVAARCPTDR